MTELTISNEMQHSIASATRQLVSKYRDYVEFHDVQQELFIWYIKNHEKVAGWEAEHHPKTVTRLVMKSLRNAGERYCRKEKAARVGYEPDDEFFYTIPMVADMLQLYFDPTWVEPRGIQLGETKSGRPPEEGWNLQAMVADVGHAYEGMNNADRALLKRIYDGNIPVSDAIALEALDWDITQNAADHRIRRVLGRLRQKLGGPRPYPEV